jgi:hypothetical protein
VLVVTWNRVSLYKGSISIAIGNAVGRGLPDVRLDFMEYQILLVLHVRLVDVDSIGAWLAHAPSGVPMYTLLLDGSRWQNHY